ncbi:MAG TPA: peptidoglycan-binding protein [Candidatus Paceibacterota bacterium]|nr:peptidoglycan-binding protein [Candidatus Paceibacterota bacterium]
MAAIILAACLVIPASLHAESAPGADAQMGVPTFTRTLYQGLSGSDVTELQGYLKTLGYFSYPATTDYYGPVTAAAVRAFQADHGLPQTGIVDPQTWVFIGALGADGAKGGSQSAVGASEPAAPVLTRSLSIGSKGDDVSALQRFLKALGYFAYPSITGYFGQVTADAVIAFQRGHGIDPIGIVGPQTRAAIALIGAVVSQGTGTPSPPQGQLPSAMPIPFVGSGGESPSRSSGSGNASSGTIDLDFANKTYTVNGTAVSLDSLIGHSSRTGDETCSWADGHLTVAGPDDLCVTDLGLAVEPASTNEFTHSGDLSAGAWTSFTTSTGVASATGDAGTAPDGTDTATLVTVSRSSTPPSGFGANAQWIATFTATPGVSTASIYLKAYAPADVGKKITLVVHGASYTELDLTLTSGWTRYSINGATFASSESIAVGYSGLTANAQDGQTQFLAWGVQAEPGSVPTAYIPTTDASASRGADAVVAAGSLASALNGTAGTVTVVTDGGIAARDAALIGADGSVLLGKTGSDLLESTLGSTVATLSNADWTAVATSSLSFDASGRSIALNGGSVITDAQAKPSATTYSIGSIGGTSSFFGGTIRHLTVATSKLADSAIGLAPLVSPGTLGSGFSFNGANTLIVPTSSSLQFSSAFSVSLWVKTSSLNGTAQSMFLKNKPSGVNTGFVFGDNGPFNGGEVFSTQPNSSGGVCGDAMACFSRSLINDGAWHHVVGVYSGSDVKIYLDGTLEDTRTAASSFVNNTSPFYIGAGLTGTLSDIRIYSRALTQADISTLYADGGLGTVPATGSALNAGLIAYWPMNASTIGTGAASATDLSGNGNTAYLDVTPPSVSITSPANGATVSGSVTVTASASDDHGVASVKFIVDGTTKGTDKSAPFTMTWNTGAVLDGSHAIVAVATDVGGNVATSSTVTVTTDNGLVGGTTYYVSPTGSDSNAGTSPSSPWKTVSKVNSGFYLPGDSILFEGGQTFTGCLAFTSSNVTGTSSSSPLTIGSYGTGSFTLDANCTGTGDVADIDLDGVSGVTITDGILRGNSGGASDGIWVHAPNSSTNVSDIRIENMDIGGFYPDAGHTSISGSAEVFITGYPGGRFENIYVGHSTLHGVDGATSDDLNGIYGFGNGKNIHDVTYEYNTIYDIGARASSIASGIVANGVDGGLLQHNVAHDIGANSAVCGGPGGIWTYNSNDVTIQYNEVYHVQPINYSGGCDWISYDLDGSVTNSTIQYNYSHDNFGGMIIFMTSPSTWYNNTMRYNLSVNDGANTAQSGSHGAIGFGGTASGGSFYMYNNTIWNGNTLPKGTAYAISGNFMPTTGLIANNIFAVEKDGSGVSHYLYAPITSFPSGLFFKDNDWFSIGGGTPYWLPKSGTAETSLASWQAFIPGGDTGAATSDPAFVDDTWDAICGGYSSSCGTSFKLQSGSPLIGTGLDLHQSSSTISVGTQDYFGTAIPNGMIGTGYNLGFDGGSGVSGVDTVKPTATLTAPLSGSVVSGASVSLAATASDNVGLASLRFSVDGAPIGTPGTASPYSITWDSTGVTDGAHTIAVTAEDTSGNYATTSASVMVSNAAPVISSISSGTPGETSATITWTTNTGATSRVAYGASASYDTYSALDTATTTSHQVTLSGLTSGATYHFAVISTDDFGRTSTSTDQTFTASSLPGWVESGAYIDIDFANDRAWSAATGVTTPDAFFDSYSRTGTAYAADGAGTLHAFATDVPRITDKGILVEADNTNQALWSRTFTNAVWTASGMSVAMDQTGADGSANAAGSLTATAANATLMQAVTDSTSRTRVFSVYLKRLSGTGEIDLTMDGGATWTDVTAGVTTGAYRRVSINTTSANPTIGIRLVASGDSVAADFAQEEVPGSSMFDALTSPVVTTSAAASRGKDHTKLIPAITTLMNSSDYSVLVTGTGSGRVSGNGAPLIGCSTFGGYLGLPTPTTVGEGGGCIYGSAHSIALGSGTAQSTTTVGLSRDSTPETHFVGNGGSVLTIGAATKSQTYYNVGMESANGPYYDGYITRVTFWNTALDATTLQALTAQ